jgi:hypothetical protein
MWNLHESNFPASVFGRVHRCVDFWHVVEKLAAAAKLLAKNGEDARAMVWGWRHQLRRRKDAADMIRAELVASGRDEALVDGDRPVHDAITYLQNNAARMHYAGAIQKGLPIGIGNVEATCKTLVGLRMKRTRPAAGSCSKMATDRPGGFARQTNPHDFLMRRRRGHADARLTCPDSWSGWTRVSAQHRPMPRPIPVACDASGSDWRPCCDCVRSSSATPAANWRRRWPRCRCSTSGSPRSRRA